YHGGYVWSGEEALQQARYGHPDVVLVGPSLPDMDPLACATAIRSDPACTDVPIFLMVEAETSEILRKAVDVGVDDIIAVPFDDLALLSRLRPLVRLATMHAELRHRARDASEFGLSVKETLPRPTLTHGHSLLVAGRNMEDAKAILGNEADIVSTTNFYEAQEILSRRNFDAALIGHFSENTEHLDLCTEIRNNPRLFNLPVILVEPEGSALDVAEAYRRGASRIMYRPLDAAVVSSAVLILVRRQRLRWDIRGALLETLKDGSRDTLTGIYNRPFLETHLTHRIDTARKQYRHLTVVFFRIPNVDAVREHFGDKPADHLLLQLGQWITGLLRVEDLTARWEKNEFCVVLPDSPIDEAEVVMHRIAGVISYTDFAVHDVYQPIKVWVQVGAADFQEEDTTESIIARARAAIS
ncbi:MAG: diguanylate cyclase, partial [Rhodospirillales bacterium]|nr:diguanylate cyclase [Rhodospirillales bacterium]